MTGIRHVFRTRASLAIAVVALLAVGLAAVWMAAGSSIEPPSAPGPALAAPLAATATSVPAPAPTSAPALLKPLAVEPVKGYVGDRFTVTGEGLPPSRKVEFVWGTVDGSYSLKVFPETVEFYERVFTPKRVPLGAATTDAQGRVSAAFTAPEDFGETHDIYLVLDGQDVARGGYRILPSFTMTPSKGPIGTRITFKATGIGVKVWENTWEIAWDNRYTGFMTALTTRGAATAEIRAVGPVGKHVVDVWHGGQSVPYLNWEQSPQAHIPIFTYEFTVTEDSGPPPLVVDRPAPGRVNNDPAMPRTTMLGSSMSAPSPAVVSLSPATGFILSKATVRATGLPADTALDVVWVTARGSRTSGLGWGLAEAPLGSFVSNGKGELAAAIEIPDDLGGWHTIRILAGSKILGEAPYLVQPSLVGVTPQRVKVGETFQVHIKGVGWTELDNIFAVVYDNGYMGFACGFNSNGDITLNLRAAGGPGTHLIDLYPAFYQGHGKPPWLYDTPHLTWAQDHPGLDLGYQMSAFRLAIQIVE